MSDSTLDYIDKKIQKILEHPGVWGGAEALEPLVLSLLMARHHVKFGKDEDSELLRSYRRFLLEKFNISRKRLIDLIPKDDKVHLERRVAELLQEFVQMQP